MTTDHPAAWIPACHYTAANRAPSDITCIVIHSAESPEALHAATDIAHYFQRTTAGGSAHYVVDDHDIVQCVREHDVAWAAPGANHSGIHIEIPGYARQTAAEWIDGYSLNALNEAADLVADIARRCNIPLTRLDLNGLRTSKRGLCGHVDVTNAFHRSDHTDPGANFPWTKFLQLCNDRLPGHKGTYASTAPYNLVTVGKNTFFVFYPRWVTIQEGQRFWAETIAAQYALCKTGAFLALDGAYGPITAQAVRHFQRKSGLTIDGIVGPVTAARLGLTR